MAGGFKEVTEKESGGDVDEFEIEQAHSARIGLGRARYLESDQRACGKGAAGDGLARLGR